MRQPARPDLWQARVCNHPGPPGKLRAAPVRQAEVPPCAPAGRSDGGTASQLIRGVRRTMRREAP